MYSFNTSSIELFFVYIGFTLVISSQVTELFGISHYQEECLGHSIMLGEDIDMSMVVSDW